MIHRGAHTTHNEIFDILSMLDDLSYGLKRSKFEGGSVDIMVSTEGINIHL
jgi:hypothetical protein